MHFWKANLGAGAGFALEDVYVLARGVTWAHDQGRTLKEGLELFDSVRGPHYKRLVSFDSLPRVEGRQGMYWLLLEVWGIRSICGGRFIPQEGQFWFWYVSQCAVGKEVEQEKRLDYGLWCEQFPLRLLSIENILTNLFTFKVQQVLKDTLKQENFYKSVI